MDKTEHNLAEEEAVLTTRKIIQTGIHGGTAVAI